MSIIGIVGKAGSGKDTLAGFLLEARPGMQLSFADPLKLFVQRTMGFTEDQLWGPSEKRLEPHPSGQHVWVCISCGWFGQNPRQDHYKSSHKGWVLRCAHCLSTPVQQPLTARIALQTLGTEWGRALLPSIWAKAGVDLALRVLAGDGVKAGVRGLPAYRPEVVVFSDVRFRNEAQAIQDAGGLILRITRPALPDVGGMGASHPSEAEQKLIDPDAVLVNDGTLEDLRSVAWDLAATSSRLP